MFLWGSVWFGKPNLKHSRNQKRENGVQKIGQASMRSGTSVPSSYSSLLIVSSACRCGTVRFSRRAGGGAQFGAVTPGRSVDALAGVVDMVCVVRVPVL